MQLNYQLHGEGEPLIILHGLFGTLENWGSQIKSLAERFQVIAVDLRNHGRSPHSDEMSYPLMAADILALMEQLNVSKAHILGHSMGGKAAMQLALNHPDRIDKLIVVDIAPVVYPRHHDDVFEGLFSIDLTSLKSRSQADSQLQALIKEPSVRAFLLKNLYRNEAGQFDWRMNLQALHDDYAQISAAPQGSSPYPKPVLFIKGANSNYLIPEYRDDLLGLFPKASYKVIQNAGHWPHAEQADSFSRMVLDYLG
ncbi:alpha/beta fold hydrolase [Neptuniibacter halophilus]|uniref:alpha/beta fold hydrolase n=1 Tax=Neptuniibacter halophilus TaxID=651666 RepID=UPI0025738887|nr:alpha/beta fold hydrolase [Neptuniibacter halophilus]